jgi:hypothetical protein
MKYRRTPYGKAMSVCDLVSALKPSDVKFVKILQNSTWSLAVSWMTHSKAYFTLGHSQIDFLLIISAKIAAGDGRVHPHNIYNSCLTGLKNPDRVKNILYLRQPLGPIKTPMQWEPGSISRRVMELVMGYGAKLTTHLQIVPRSRKQGYKLHHLAYLFMA